MMVFHWNLSGCKSPQVSGTLLSILAVFNNAEVWMVSTCLRTSLSSRPFNNPLITMLRTLLDTIFTLIYHSFFNSQARSRYLSFFSLSFSFILSSAGRAKPTILQCFLFIIIRSGLQAEFR